MSAIESKLDPHKFARIHRSHIVNLDFLVEIHPLDPGDATLKLRDGTSIPCSRNYRSSLRNGAASPAAPASSTVKIR
jgi:DNA-binding LytR/AlgR family response regulator